MTDPNTLLDQAATHLDRIQTTLDHAQAVLQTAEKARDATERASGLFRNATFVAVGAVALGILILGAARRQR